MFSLTIETTNAAFEDFATLEVARILHKLAARIEESQTLDDVDSLPLMDLNGNRIGEVRITD